MLAWLLDHWETIAALIGSALAAWAHGRASGKRAATQTRSGDSGSACVTVLLWMWGAATLIIAGGFMSGCSATWPKVARNAVDSVNTSTQLAWAEYRQAEQTHCVQVATTCAKDHQHNQLADCEAYTHCIGAVRDTGQVVAALHEAVARARMLLDTLADSPTALNASHAKDAWRLVLSVAAKLATHLVGAHLSMEAL